MTIERFAPAKINLTLHVTGQRADGYHLLDSLVVRVDVGDWLRVSAAEGLTLDVTGPQASGVPRDGSNLVLRAARMLDVHLGAAISLEKHLPNAAGIGGGSADAAAALQALSALWQLPLPEGLSVLGADVPVCMASTPQRMRGIGDILSDVAELPNMTLLLVNPGVPTPTGAVFDALASKQNPPMPTQWPVFYRLADFVDWLAAQRNDLEAPARALVPQIGQALDALTGDALLARMSGSGATCFGIFERREVAEASAARLRDAHPEWWVAVGDVLTLS